MAHRHAQRITRAQVAAACALMIAGLSWAKACQIVGVPVRAMIEYLPKDPWRMSLRPPRRWHDEQLAELHEYWMDRTQRTTTIAARYNLTSSQIWKIAKTQGWPPRKSGTYSPVQKHQRAIYNKLREALGRERAIAEVCRDDLRT